MNPMIYELGISLRVSWQANSLNNAGNHGTNRMFPRRQLLADGIEVDASSGNMHKHQHAHATAEQMEALGLSLCPACQRRDGRRAMALIEEMMATPLTMERILLQCGLCDTHGFLVTGKRASKDSDQRQALSKHSLVEFGFALGLPEQWAETAQLFTRVGDMDAGQMIMHASSRSGQYALSMRYKAAGIGVDTNLWQLIVDDAAIRQKRHQAIIQALRDQLLSPSGAMTTTMLPHLTGLAGVITIRHTAGRAPLYSALQPDFMEQLQALAFPDCTMLPFNSIAEFAGHMNALIATSVPALPPACTPAPTRKNAHGFK